MIHYLTANDSRFNSVRFESGFNLILADRTEESSEQDSRNGLGKTSLVNLVQFCLGGKLPENLDSGILDGWAFSMTVDIAEKPTTLVRSVDNRSRITIERDGWDLGVMPLDRQVKVDDLTTALGNIWFGLDSEDQGKYNPTFRSLISYFARRRQDAYVDPLKHFHSQAGYSQQILQSYLAGLDWTYPRNQRLLHEEAGRIRALRQASREGVLEGVVATAGELRAIRIQLERRLADVNYRIHEFRVHPKYRTLEAKAEDLSGQIRSNTNQLAANQRLLRSYEEGVAESESGMAGVQLEALYAAVSLQLPDLVINTLDDIKQFHEQLRQERFSYLRSEMNRLRQAIKSINDRITSLEGRRSQALDTLNTHGSIDELESLRSDAVAIERQLGAVTDQARIRRRIDHGADEVRTRQLANTEAARRAFEGTVDRRDRLVELFDQYWEQLYGIGGRLVIDITDSGYAIDFEVERSGSQGVDRMTIFAFDLAVAQVWTERGQGPGFLIHDSLVWDGVDERQVAAGLKLADSVTKETGLQYITSLNSDMIPASLASGSFILDSVVLRLTDADDTGRLFGFRF